MDCLAKMLQHDMTLHIRKLHTKNIYSKKEQTDSVLVWFLLQLFIKSYMNNSIFKQKNV